MEHSESIAKLAEALAAFQSEVKDPARDGENPHFRSKFFPTSSAYCFAEAVKAIEGGAGEVVVYNEYFGATPVVLTIRCIG